MNKKRILQTLIGLAIVVIAVLLIVAFSMGSIIKSGVEKIGPTATQVPVTLKSAEVWIMSARLRLTDFVLGNPPGYKTPSSISVGDVTVSVKPGSVFSDKLVVDSIAVKSPVITLEGGLSGNNLQKIEKNLNDYIGSSSTAPSSTAPPASPAKSGKKLQVNDLLITGAKVQFNSELSANRTITLAIPEIHLTGLGDGPDGITPVEVGQRALHSILAAATEAVAQNAGKLGKEAVGESKDVIKGATEGIKGLFHRN